MISLVSILIVVIITGAILWLINTYVPMDSTIKNVFNSIVVIVTILWVLNSLGLFSS
ncbi:Thivi_2564 family membrane protein [Flavobacterium hiemivividum]|uniref:Thivi_2564 family membrane protein n=1 Tax=Flavobacterium hiemivividum TaxID=2541734 RepID=UPI002939353D|nr:Thivi_2564 family membrane protein [Flavobacterium hiemivividum]